MGAWSPTGISDGHPECICDTLSGTLESKLLHHLSDQVVVGPQEGIGLDPASKVNELRVAVMGDAVVTGPSLAGNIGDGGRVGAMDSRGSRGVLR